MNVLASLRPFEPPTIGGLGPEMLNLYAWLEGPYARQSEETQKHEYSASQRCWPGNTGTDGPVRADALLPFLQLTCRRAQPGRRL